MVKGKVKEIVHSYLMVYPKEVNRLLRLNQFLQVENEICDENNFNGHITIGAFLYAKKTKEFLLLRRKDLEVDLYLGGHINMDDWNILLAAWRELREETGVIDAKEYLVDANELVPLDIDIYKMGENEKDGIPSHYHYDFRYLFIVDEKIDVMYDRDKIKDYKWIGIEEMKKYRKFENIISKLDGLEEV